MDLLILFAWTTSGVLLSFALPPLLRAAGVMPNPDPTASLSSFSARLRAILSSRAVITTVLSLVLALLVVALLEDQLDSWNMALLSGLAWQSILARTLAPGT